MSRDSRTDEPRPLTRRSTLQTLGTLVVGSGAAGTAAAADDGAYTVVQGDTTFTVEPISGDVPVEEFYSFRLPDGYVGVGVHSGVGGPFYESVGTRALQREATTITFLYDGPDGVSLVVVHDRSASDTDGDGGSATWDVFVHDADAQWLVQDDKYWDEQSGEIASTNYDRWETDGNHHRIDWTWADGGTDGGALGHLNRGVALLIDPSFNEAAALYDEHYEGDITDWEFLGGSVDAPKRHALALDEPLAVVGPTGDLSAIDESVLDGSTPTEGGGEETTETGEETTEKETTETDDGTTEEETPTEDGDDEKTDEETETTDEETETPDDGDDGTTEEETADEETDDDDDDDRNEDDGQDDEDDREEDWRDEYEDEREKFEEKREKIEEKREELAEKREEKREKIREKFDEDEDDDDEDDERSGRGRGRGKGENGKKNGKGGERGNGKKQGKRGKAKGKEKGDGEDEGRKLGW